MDFEEEGQEEILKPIPKRKERPKTNMADLVKKLVQHKKIEEEKRDKIEKIKAAREAMKVKPKPAKPKSPEKVQTPIATRSRNGSSNRASTRSSSGSTTSPSRQNGQDNTISPYGEPLPPIDSPDKSSRNDGPTVPTRDNVAAMSARSNMSGISARTNMSNVSLDNPNTAIKPIGAGMPSITRGNAFEAEKEEEEDWRGDKTLVECNTYMLENEINCDVTMLMGEEEEAMLAHSYVLMSRSSSFNTLIQRDAYSVSKLYSFPDVDPEIFKLCIRYIYTDKIEITDDNAPDVITLAHKMELTSLRRKCFEIMLDRMNPTNACILLEKAHFYHETEIFDTCKKFIRANGKEVLEAPSVKELCRKCMGEIVSSDELNADEVTVFKALLYWASSMCKQQKLAVTDENRRQVLEELLYCVRYCLMDVKDFTQHVSPREVLVSDEKIALFQYFHDSSSDVPFQFSYKKPRRYNGDDDIGNQSNNNRGKNGYPNAKQIVSNEEKNGLSNEKAKADQKKLPDPDIVRSNTPIVAMSRVVRFKKINGTWHSKGPDAITFWTSHHIILFGVQIYGSMKYAAKYTVNVTVFNQTSTAVLNDCVAIEIEKCGIADVLFTEPVYIPQDRQFTVELLIHGNVSTARGINGMEKTDQDGVTFNFKDSGKSANGTSVNTGQIPGLIFTKRTH